MELDSSIAKSVVTVFDAYKKNLLLFSNVLSLAKKNLCFWLKKQEIQHIFLKIHHLEARCSILPFICSDQKKKPLRTEKVQDVASAPGRMDCVLFGFVHCLSHQAPDWPLSISDQ